jgi:hypothetical protein
MFERLFIEIFIKCDETPELFKMNNLEFYIAGTIDTIYHLSYSVRTIIYKALNYSSLALTGSCYH